MKSTASVRRTTVAEKEDPMLVTQQPVLKRFWYPVIPLSMLDDGPKPFVLLGEKIVLWKDGEGRVSCLEDRCCHRSAELSRGFYDQGGLACGYHGWTYDRTGRCVRIPQMERSAVPEGACVRAYRAETRYGYVWVCLDDEPLLRLPEFPEATDPAYRMIPQFYESWQCAGLRLMENSFDPAHVNFVHRATFGDPVDAGPVQMEVTDRDFGFHMNTKIPIKNIDLAKSILRIDSNKTTREIDAEWWLPFLRYARFKYPTGLVHAIMTCATPIDDRFSMVSQVAWRNDTEEQAKAVDIIEFDRRVTHEDRYILEGTDPDVPLDNRFAERNVATDKPGVLMRRKLLAMLAAHGEKEATRHAPPAAATATKARA
jgi:phenylpropionate dioxygenase-like ring-hydroxylating dioxygenase large terminal subunit